MKIKCLGGFREVGRNAVLIDSKEQILLDFGIDVEEAEAPIIPQKVDHCFIAHTHLDHVGSLPVVTRFKCPVYATAATFDQTHMLLKDAMKLAKIKEHDLPYTEQEAELLRKREQIITYGQEIRTRASRSEIYSAGHVPGSMIHVLEIDGKRILYTSDFNTNDTRLLKGADVKNLKNIDILITESTYAAKDHPDRREQEQKLWEIVRETVENGGIALIPAFAIGRSAELLMVLDSFRPKFPVYLDGMAKAATEIALKYPEMIRDAKALNRAMNNVRMVKNNIERKDATKEPCAIITTGGCIDGGPAVQYIRNLWGNEKNSLTFTGFQIPKTAGRYLLDTGRYVTEELDLKIKMQINSLDFSAHSGREDLFKFINKLNPGKVICMHGDNCQRFAKELKGRGFDAEAPENGDILKI